MPDEGFFQNALLLLERGDTAGAVADLKTYLASEPEDDAAWLALGTAHSALGQHADAVSALKEAVSLDGDVFESRLALGRALAKTGKLDDAAFQLLRAQNLQPDNPTALFELGVVFYDKHLFQKAEGFLNRAAAHGSSTLAARAKYALGLTHEAQKNLPAAIADYRDAIALDPHLMDARRTLADALAALGEHESAVTELTHLLEVERSNEQAAKNREVLLRALAEMKQKRLLGKTENDLFSSALVQEGQLKRKGRVPDEDPNIELVRYTRPFFELYVAYDTEHKITRLTLVVTDPTRAAEEQDEAFKVTAIGDDGKTRTTNLVTAMSLTFVREALGCPMTQATSLYGRLLGGEPKVEWGGAAIGWKSIPRPDKPTETRHGLSIAKSGLAVLQSG
ncbi:MAG: tetratricopeptide repeat protein [Polyangiaceae bacterium]|nr:tetratricopeptide repeat protein [Polyangiaceae bacterium]